jgi:hypothetical protein
MIWMVGMFAIPIPVTITVAVLISIPVPVVIAISGAALALLVELATPLISLAAVFSVFIDRLVEPLLGLADLRYASVIAVAILRGRDASKQQDPAQRCREQRGLPSLRFTQHVCLLANFRLESADWGSDALPATCVMAGSAGRLPLADERHRKR